MKPPRKTPTKALERRVIMEAGAKCPWCKAALKLKAAEIHIHHIDGDRSNTVFENLILTCRNHHGQIEARLIPEWEVRLKKTCLSNPATLERLGLESIRSELKPRRKRVIERLIGGDNFGVAAKTINNIGTLAGSITYQKTPANPIQVVGSLVTSVDHYGYVEYLIKRLSHYRSWRPGAAGPPDNPGAVRKIFERETGRLPKDFPLARFNDAVEYLLEKISNTALGRIGKARVSSFEEWKLKGKSKSKVLHRT
jgi:hypothetical protein